MRVFDEASMFVCGRRNFHKFVLSTVLSAIFSKNAYSLAGELTLMEQKLFGRSGDDDFDRALIAELKRIVHVLDINPGFKYMDSHESFATSETIVPGTNGTVLLGLQSMRTLMQDGDGGVGVAGVCAYMCGYIYQFQTDFYDRIHHLSKGNGDMRCSLHAAFIAGYYIGRRNEFAVEQIKKVSSVISKHGDYKIDSPHSHGTPGQQSAAVDSGYRAASDGNSMTKAAEIGLSYVMNL